MDAYKVVSSEKTHNGLIVDIVVDTISLPDGKQAKRELIVRGGAAAIIPIDKDGNIVFVKQYRHTVKKLVLEIPAGMLEKDEDPYECAMRELEEETSFKTDKLTLLTTFYPSAGFCTEYIAIYFAENLTKGKMNLDDDEFIEVETHSLESAVEMIFKGEIFDSKTIIAILMYKEYCCRALSKN